MSLSLTLDLYLYIFNATIDCVTVYAVHYIGLRYVRYVYTYRTYRIPHRSAPTSAPTSHISASALYNPPHTTLPPNPQI